MNKNKRNYYRILHVQPDAPLALIQASYRTLMQKLRMHPDLGGDEWNAALLNEAYAVLSDERRRSQYDSRLFVERTRAETGRQTPAQRANDEEPDPAPSSVHCADAAHQEEGQASRSSQPQRSAYGTAFVDSHSCAFCGSAFRGVMDSDTDCPHCQSPLQRLEPLELESTGQRNIARVPLMSRLSLHTAWPGPPDAAVLHDLSPNGLQFVAGSWLVPGQRVRLDCPMFTAVAEIANRAARPGQQHRYGARFVALRYHAARGTFVSTSV